jgi:hypothetical protein
MRTPRVGTLAALAALAGAAPAAAQVPVTPRALGVGGGYVAAARGEEALWQNPANLGLPGSPHWSFGIPTLSAGADVLGLDVGDIKDIILYRKQTDQRKQELLDQIPSTGTGLRADVRAPLFAAQIRHLSFGFSYNTLGSHTLGKSFLDLLLFGFQTSRLGNYNITPAETQGFRATYWDFAAGYGHRLPIPAPGALTAGATVHFYRGSGIVRSGITRVDTTRNSLGVPNDIHITYAGVRDKGGSGFGVDLGAAYQPMPNLTLSAAVSNVVNSFDWGGDRTLKTVTLTQADYRNGNLQDVLDRYDASETAYNAAGQPARVQALANDLGVDVKLPRTLRIGAALVPHAGTTLSAAYQDNLSTSRTGGLWDKSLSGGVQQRLAFLSLRAGLASDLSNSTLLSGGLSLGPIHLGVARITDGSNPSADRKGWIATFGLATASQSTMP